MDALVLDLTRLLPGPLAARILGSLGLRVLRLTRPQGDLLESAEPELHKWLNAGKEQQQLDLKSAAGVERLRALAREASVLLEGDLPGVMERLGVGPEVLRKDNPRLVYVRISGYRAENERHLPGHDLTYMAASGMLAGLGATWKHLQLADLCGGFWAAMAALDGLRKGGGSYEVYLSDAYGAVNHPQLSLLNGSIVCYNLYDCLEGQIAFASIEPAGWQRFCELTCHPEWLPHAFSAAVDSNPVFQDLCALFRTRTATEWDELGAGNRLSLRAVQKQASSMAMPPWRNVEP